jgi:hypothetical protein
MSSIRVYVDLDDVYDEMDRRDKQNIAEWLYEDGVLESHPNSEIRKIVRGNEESFGEKELRDNLSKIWNSYYQLSNEDCELIKNLANKL